MKKIMFISLAILIVLGCVLVYFTYPKFVKQQNKQTSSKQLFNIVMIGAAGSGKGTQSELIKNKLNLLQISAGEVLRNFVQNNPDSELTKQIKEYTDNGKLVPSDITHQLIRETINNEVLCDGCNYRGIIFDGFPREKAQLEFLDNVLAETNNKVNAVVFFDIDMDKLIDRLSGRFMCAKCGEIYHKVAKPTHKEGVCDKCGSTEFKVRDDDQNKEAISERLKIFNEQTKPLLDIYNERGIVIKMDGAKEPQEISIELLERLQQAQQQDK